VSPEPTPAEAGRAYGAALFLLAVGGVLLLVGFGMVWAHATVPLAAGVDTAMKDVTLAGRDLLPLAAASGWIALAGLAGIVATRSWGRTTIAGVVLVAGLAGSAYSLAFAMSPHGFVESVTQSPATSLAAGWLVSLTGGLCTVAAAVWTLARGRRWPVMGARYERSTPQRVHSAWELQDMGQDPTDDLVE
jgi:hypothetical protein